MKKTKNETDSGCTGTVVSNTIELNQQISNANSLSVGDTLTICLNSNITLDQSITPINTAGSVTIDGTSASNFMINGNTQYQGFVILGGTVTLQNMSIINMLSNGQNGCMAAGAGLFVANFSDAAENTYNATGIPTVTLVNVNFGQCYALSYPGVSPASISGNGIFGVANQASYFGVCGNSASVIGGYGAAGYVQAESQCNSGFAGSIDTASPPDLMGAGLGGGIFVMDNASLSINGTCLMLNNTATYTYAYYSTKTIFSSGIFLQGSGSLSLNPGQGDIMAIYDIILDETGACSLGLTYEASPYPAGSNGLGPDGITYTGGTGVWNITLNGEGTLSLNFYPQVSGLISIVSGILDVSYNNIGDVMEGMTSSPASNNLTISPGGTLTIMPTNPTSGLTYININTLSLDNGAIMNLNAFAYISVQSVVLPETGTVTLNMSEIGFFPNVPVPILYSPNGGLISAKFNVQPTGFEISVSDDGTTMSVTLN